MSNDTGPTIQPADRLGDLVAANPVLAPVLDHLRIDYCCGGDRNLGDACAEAGLDVAETVDTLRRAATPTPGAEQELVVTDLTPSALVDHIEATHHAYLRRELPRIAELAERVLSVHGEHHPELAEVHDTFHALRLDLEPHLDREELIVFPLIREIDAALRSERPVQGTLDNSVTVLRDDHENVGALMAQLSLLTDTFTAPADGCASYRAFYDGLRALVADTHVHVHKENNILFPAATENEQRLRSFATRG